MTAWYDQSGFGRDLGGSTSNGPGAITSGPNSRPCVDFRPGPGYAETMSTFGGGADPDLMSDVMSASEGYIVVSLRADVIIQDPGAPDAIISPELCAVVLDTAQDGCGLTLRSGGMLHAFNDDTGGFPHDYDFASSAMGAVPVSGNPCVIEWWHQDGFINQRVNGAGLTSVLSGDTVAFGLDSAIEMGFGGTGGTEFDGKIFEAMIFRNVPPLAERDAIVADMMDWVGA